MRVRTKSPVIYVILREKDRTFEFLERGYRERSISMPNLKCDWRLAPLHGDPRFEDLLSRLAYPPEPGAARRAGRA